MFTSSQINPLHSKAPLGRPQGYGVSPSVSPLGYGDLGSTYDRLRGGRPLRRSEAAVVLSTPWATQLPVGLARLLPGDLRGTPKARENAVSRCAR